MFSLACLRSPKISLFFDLYFTTLRIHPLVFSKISLLVNQTRLTRSLLPSSDTIGEKFKSRTIISRNMSVKTDGNSGMKQFNERFLDSAARGDVDELDAVLGAVDINLKSSRGWTALMFAARNGHSSIISKLIEKGCDINALNSTGQTALDIAQFWNHVDAASILSQHRSDLAFEQTHNYYSLNPLYRASDMRKDREAILKTRQNKKTKYILFANREPFLVRSETGSRKYKFVTMTVDEISGIVLDTSCIVFLGLETWDPESSAWFAIDVGDQDVSMIKEAHKDGSFYSPFPVTMQMEPSHAGIFAEAHSILCWLDRYRFCPTCGSKNNVVEGGYKQVCSNSECSSLKGIHNTSYPRVDPSLIMLVLSPDKKKCLLGRGRKHPPKMYSCLAGFMEPGECIEDTCRREVEEESGVKIGQVDYHSSQPWPFPASLMLGCIAYARTDTLCIDKEELEDVRWFQRAEVAQMLARQHPDGIFIPPAEAIAHQLIKSWITSSIANL